MVLTPRNGWMRSGVDAVVEAKKEVANDAAPKSPEDSADTLPPPPARISA